MEIEKKYLIKQLPSDITGYPHHIIEQAYISTNPVIRIRHFDDDYILTVKSEGLIAREEFELPLSINQYNNLLTKTEGNIVTKTRYMIPLKDTETAQGIYLNKMLKNYESLAIEADIFSGIFEGLIYAEVEFYDINDAESFTPPKWFYRDVTEDTKYTNSSLSSMSLEEIKALLTAS